MLTGFVHVRRAGIALVTSVAFSAFTGATALARVPLAAESLPEPVSLVLYEPAGTAPAPVEVAAAAPDAPEHVPASEPAMIGKVLLVTLALVGLVVVVGLVILAIMAFDLVTNNE